MSYLTDYPFLNTTGIDPLPLKKKEGLGERERGGGRKKREMGEDVKRYIPIKRKMHCKAKGVYKSILIFSITFNQWYF